MRNSRVSACQTPTDHALQDHIWHCGHPRHRLPDTSTPWNSGKSLPPVIIISSVSFLVQFVSGIPCQPVWQKLPVWYPLNGGFPICQCKLSDPAMQIHTHDILKLCCRGLRRSWYPQRRQLGKGLKSENVSTKTTHFVWLSINYSSDFSILLSLSH